MKQESEKERYTPMGQKAESEDSQVDMDEIRRRLDAEDKVIEYLAGEIAKERKKPAAQQDQSRIEKCLDTIAKLKNHKIEYSQEELKAKANALLSKAHAKEESGKNTAHAPTHRYRLRPALVVVILLVVVCLLGTTACGVIPSLRMWFARIVNNPGASVDDNGITYSYNGQAVIYEDIEELLEKEQLDIFYPSKFPEGVKLENVQRKIYNGHEEIIFVCNTLDVSFLITFDYSNEFVMSDIYSEYKLDNLTVYCREDQELNRYIAIFIHDNKYYFLAAKDQSSLYFILDNMRGKGL